ncbi:amino acid adenylation domain-containing protein [Amycolatopsis sp., V23-08]|uniref:Amino acid adenylation domain-containing protein n=1 Tax=Amycolatopsis heterodermiae TaxID=3110235 RepID=A0ABU5R8H4_9PSEU|nr:non-ribosomal peptide synthetase [Amycolatopsis sp., V23-08]MEA5362521.1 amino acid adenylation domain-containing protein [Amycolatopsis sp., V23-08]
MTSIARRVHDRALRHPDAVAVSDGDRLLTYAELDAGAAAVAESLSRKGVRPGDAVAVGLPRSLELVQVMLGVLRLGGQVVPLDRQSPPARRDVVLADAGAAAVVHDGLPGLPPLTPADLLAGTAEAGAPAEPAPASFLFYTSGTTGRPKGVEVRDAGVLRLAEPGWLDRGTRFACLANPAFDAISFEVWVPLLTGGTCVVLGDDTVRDPRAFADALVRERIDTMFVTATLFNAVAETVPDSFSTVRRVVIGGEQLNAPLIRRWYRANPDAPTRLQNGYGPTETTTFALSYAIPRGFDGDVVPIGRPLPGTGVVAVTADQRVAAEGELAELYVSGAGVALGYRGLPVETGQRFVRLPWLDDGRARFYRTGDLVRVLPGGRFAYAGRTDRQVKVRGYRIEPGELEQRLLAHPGIRQAHVAVRRAATAELLAFVVAGELSFDAFDAHLSATVPAYMRPHHVFRVGELPRNANGKVDETALLAGGFAPWRPDAGGEATAWEREVLDVVSDVLDVPDLHPGDTWLRSGGDSLKALRLRFALRERWGADLAPSVVQRGTYADLAAAVAGAGRADYPDPGAPATVTSAPATSEQQRLWLLQQRNPASTAYHVPLAFEVTGAPDVEALRRDVRGLVERHPALRTAFEATSDGLRQVTKAPYDPWTEPGDDFFTAPFDLASGALMRAAWRPDGTFLLCLHHIAVDGWSLNILFRELSGVTPKPDAHTPLDFAGWQSRWFASPAYRAQLGERVDDAEPLGEASLAGRLHTTRIDRERVDAWAGELGLTRFQLLLGVFAWSLYAVTGRTRPRIAAPVANRPVRAFEDSVGMFANTVRLPLSVDPDEELDAQLRRLGEAAGAALDGQDIAFADLDPGYAAFDYLFVLENTDFGALRLPGCSVSPQWIEAAEAKCALTLSVVERPDGFDCLWEYSKGHFTEAEAAALGDVFDRALHGDARTPDRRDHGRGPTAELTWETVAEGFARQVALTPDAPALTGDTTLTYAELDAHAARLAATLPEDATDIALHLRPSAEHVVALLALARLNITAVPLDPAYPPALLREVLDQVKPHCVLLAPGEEFETDVERRFVTLTGGPVPDVPARHAGRPLYTLFTSGSTGVPKGVRVPDRTLANLLQWQDMPPATTQQFSMLSFDVSFQEIFTTLCGGGRLHLVRPEWRRDVPALLERLETAGIERIFLPYVALQLLAEHGVRLERYPSRLRDVVTAGEQLVCTPAIRRWFAGLPGARLHNHYGPTETHVVSALTLDGDPAAWPERPAIGRPVANAVLRVADASGAPLPPGQAGELLIGGLAANRCYLGETASEKFAELPELYYRSGDLAHFDRAGLLHFDGRADRQVKLSGYRLELGQVEAALLRHPDVVNAVVVPENGRLTAVLECRRTPSAPELTEHLVPLLPPHARVDRFRVVDALPRTPSGKLDRDAAPLVPGTDLQRTPSAPSSELATLFEEVTGSPIGPDETFFAAGATSLSLMRFHLRCAEAGYRFTAADLFEHVTLRDLTRHLESGPAPARAVESGGVDEPVAVVGMAVRLPGAADLAAFWDLVVTGRRGIEEFPAAEGLVGARSLLDGPLAFDPEHFGISHRDAALMDPQQRQLLMACAEALAHAGIPGSDRVGLIAGCGENTYFQQMLREADPAALPDGFQLALHHEKDFLATKVAFHLDLRGPALTTQTACSSSLVAVHQAAAMLRGGEADVMLAGGVLVDVTLAEGYRYRPQHIFSADGHCRPFSDDADGTVGASGVGVVVLKPLSAARRDGDTVYSVLTGSALTNDGAVKQGYSAPSPAGQREAIRAALRRAGRTGAEVGYVETHGTGTRLGDPIEVAALREAMPDAAGCALSSVKSQLGHLGAAAGVVGLIRATLAIHHGVLPPTVDFRAPNPALELGPFRVPTRAEPWPAGPRVAGVSSFGIGGTNAHAVLEAIRPVPVSRPEPVRCLVLSARSAAALRLEAARVADYLAAHPESFVDVLRHLQSGRRAERWRLAGPCDDATAAIELLRTAEPQEVPALSLSRESDGPAAVSRETDTRSTADRPLSQESGGSPEASASLSRESDTRSAAGWPLSQESGGSPEGTASLSRESDGSAAVTRESAAAAELAAEWLAGVHLDWGLPSAPAPWDFPPPAFVSRDFDFPRRAAVARLPESAWLHQPVWVRLRRVAPATRADRVLVISGEGPLVAPALEAAYARVVRVHAARHFARLGPDSFEADPADSAALRQILDALSGNEIDWLHTLPLGITGPLGATSVDHAAWACLDTPAALLRAAHDRPIRTWWVSAGAAPANGAVTRPEAGLLAGVSAVGPQESGVPGHWVDLPTPDLAPLADLLTGPTPPERVALRGGFWWAQDTAPVDAGPLAVADGTHLVLGGTGGIGTAVAEELLTRTSGRVILLARNPFLPEALKPWADRVDLIAADLTTVTADEIGTPLAGIVHAAGNPGGGLIATRGEGTQSVKLAGALLTEQLVERDQPAYVVYCSSLSAQFGGTGQLDYAAANGFLDALAHRDGPTARLSIGWDVWRDTGMAVTALETDTRHQAHLAVGLNVEEGRRTFARALGSGLPQLLVATTGLETARAFHERDRTPAGPKPAGDAGAELTEEVRALLGVAELDPDVPLYDLGADSLTLLDVVDSAKRLFGVDLDLAWLGPEVTMAGLLAKLTAAGDTGEVTVQVWREGTGREAVCLVHPVGGDVHAYRPLVEALDPRLGVCVIADPALSRPEPPGWSVSDRAHRYHLALQGKLPGRTWQLAGWSFGAWVAAGMAAEAETAGRPVRALHLVDPPPPGASAADYSDAELEAVFARELGTSGGTAGEHARRLASACRANLASMTGHRLPRLTTTPSHVWLAAEPEPGLPVADRAGWRALLPEPSRWHELPATHYGIVRAPHVTAIAAAIGL